MNFDVLDEQMRVYETAHDHRVLPGVFIVTRIDGRNFTRLTKERHAFQAPFDPRVRDLMVGTTSHLMGCGFRVVYGYTQSDEISLLHHLGDETFSRKERKLNSVLAGEASAKFTQLLGDLAVFDCRVCQIPSAERVVDYFMWRAEDAHRNALNAHCYWSLRREGREAEAATSELVGLTVAEKNELLFRRGVNFNDLPAWQKRGTGVTWGVVEKVGVDPRTGERVKAERRRLAVELELPLGEAYARYLRERVADASS